MHKLLLSLAVALLTQCAGCKTKDPFPNPPPTDPLSQLPAETQTGQRTFGCLLNGQPWTQAGDPLSGPLLTCGYLNRRLAIVANRAVVINGATNFQRISLVIDKMSQQGTYTLNDSTQRFAHYENDATGCDVASSSKQPSGNVILTRFDPVARIVSGRFAFTLETPRCGKIVVTDGRFDVKF